LNPEFTHIGIACGCHTVIGEVCCFAYGKNVNDGNQGPVQSLIDAPRQECSEATSKGIKPISSDSKTPSGTSNPRNPMQNPQGSRLP